ncbi:MAG: ABC transporter ATP-binding protein [Acidimicrobiaceae bacterium]|jgi:ATP-binding cassette, subfamily B, bacterial|nr:ABC transporter ATP-binding protein [Acidimicrobiaceae bacterium]MBT5849243.1 ABC transporter ATP-binding protein [Acidimicrobiaceae bacterium]
MASVVPGSGVTIDEAGTSTRSDDPRYPRPVAAINPDTSLFWVRRIWPVVWSQKLPFVASIIAGLIGITATVFVPVMIGRGITAVDDANTVRPYVITLVILAVIRFVFGFAYRFGLFRSALRIENDLRNLMYERLTELSFDFWDRTQSGQIISRANTDIRSIQMLFAFGPLVAMQLVLLGIALVVMLLVDVTLTAVALAPLPFVYIIGIRLRNRIFPLSWVVTARQAEVATIVDENIQGIRVVKAFAQERRQVQVLARAARRLRWAGTTLAETRARHAPAMESLPRLGLALVLFYGGQQAIDGEINIGHLVAFSTYVVLLAAPFRMLGFILLQWERAGAAAVRVFEILDEQPSIRDPDDPVPLGPVVGRVEFDNVGFSYPTSEGEAVLDGLSFTIEAGETIALVGATGSGKSTIARLLPRFYDVDSGAVRVDGHDVRTLKVTELRTAVSQVTDDPFLFATSVHNNVAFARPDCDDAIVNAAINDAAATDFVNDLPLGVETEIGERGLTLSGGQRQRLAIARTLVADPAVLVLDDATSAIDVAVEERIHDALTRRRANRTTILIAHRLSTIALADRVVLIEDGKVSETGRHHDLLASNPRYAAILADTTNGGDR